MGRKKGSKNKPKSTSAPVVDLTAADDDDGPLASLAVVDLTRADDDAPTPAVLTNANANANAKKRKRANAPAPTASIAAASPPPRPMQRPERADESLAETTTTTTTIRLDDDDDDELASVVCFGAMASAIVGIQYNNGIVSRKEQVTLHREPRNQYDRNALRVDNVRREQVGHIPRDVAAHLSPLIDAKKIHHVVGVVTSGTNNRYRMPVSVFLYGRESDRAHVTQRLRNGGVRLGLADGVASKVIEENPPGCLSQSDREDALDALFDRLEKQKLVKATMEPSAVVTSPMYAHQKEALAWLVSRENANALPPFWTCDAAAAAAGGGGGSRTVYENILSNHKTTTRPECCRGGILADDMGLGKTLEIIALIATNRPGCSPSTNAAAGAGAGEAAAAAATATAPPPAKKKKNTKTAGGTVLATSQDAIGRTFSLPKADGPKTTLVVCPLSVLSNWEKQLEDHTDGSLTSYRHHGSDRSLDAAHLERHDVVITTYGTLASDIDGVLGRARFLRVVLDEAHNVKNPRATQTLAAYKVKADRRWAITGTPIQNRLSDLHSLLAFVRLAPLDDRQFWMRNVEKPVKIGDPRGFDRLVTTVAAMALRRTKDQRDERGEPIVHLPKKTVVVQRVDLDAADMMRYRARLAAAQDTIGAMLEDGSVFRDYATALELILRLRQLCCHGDLVPAESSAASAAPAAALTEDALKRLLDVLKLGGLDDCCICLNTMHAPVVTRCAHVFCRGCLAPALERKATCPLCRAPCAARDLVEAPADETEDGTTTTTTTRPSAKVTALVDRLRADLGGEPGAKAVVFSQFVAFLDIARDACAAAGFKTCRITGAVPVAERERVIRSFQSNASDAPDVVFVSLKAGGVGINLTAASKVYMLDPWWNPAVEEQAMDRVHRLGQTKDVTVVRFAATDTIEEKMLELQRRKRELARAAFEKKTEAERRAMRRSDLSLLLSINSLRTTTTT